jgi:hypothetical protein
MGILDDAIREHLDLKRRRGADPAEVERLEREALGPVRRPGFEHDEDVLQSDYTPETAYGEEIGGAPYAAAPPATAYVEEPDYVEPGEEEPLVDEAPAYQPPQPPADEAPVAPPRHHEIAEAWDAHEALQGPATKEPVAPEEPALSPQPPVHAAGPAPEPDVPLTGTSPPPEATPEESGHPPHRGDTLDEETAEFDVEGAHEEDGQDDMLEETPDFLQDTPEHDRLWFEQRPPRDFDFDG